LRAQKLELSLAASESFDLKRLSILNDGLLFVAHPMSALGHEQTSRHVRVMSVIPLKADIHQRGLHVRLVPLADITAVMKLGPLCAD
jgi:hypothetical protein